MFIILDTQLTSFINYIFLNEKNNNFIYYKYF